MKERGLTMKALSLAAGLGETAVRDMLESVGSPRLNSLSAVADVLGLSLSEFLEGGASQARRVPVIGYVSAGEGWSPFDGDGPIDEIEITLHGGEAVALTVRGDSMAPVYRDGDTLIGTKRPTSNARMLVGADCIIATRAGERFVKFLARGTQRGRFNLKSYNPAHPDRENVEIQWAAPIDMIIRGRR